MKSFQILFFVAREASRERCPVCDQLEPHTNNCDSAKRAKKRRLVEKEEMDRIKKQNAHLERRVADLEARLAALANDHNKLHQHHNLVLSLGANPAGNLARLISNEAVSVKVTFDCYMLRNGMPEKIKGVDPLKSPSPDHPSTLPHHH
jgi:hypothetical protein